MSKRQLEDELCANVGPSPQTPDSGGSDERPVFELLRVLEEKGEQEREERYIEKHPPPHQREKRFREVEPPASSGNDR
jgi:hypothetical protein